jgi:DNA-binding SARP family transcriptional activator/tetratricopeptide (TPR) repeat protein
MEFSLLGPLLVRSGETQITIPAGKQRVLLAALLFSANRVVPVDELTEVLWDGGPPASARPTLLNYVKRLRQALGEAGRSRIVTWPPGYQVVVTPAELDVTRFESLQRSAQEATSSGAWEQAASLLRAALALWRGKPLADVPSLVLEAREMWRLGEMRLQALEARIDADLHLGRGGELIGEIQALAAAHPLREGFHAQLMLALHSEGRQGEALAAFQHARQVLIAELGLEPGPALQELHQRILTADPSLAVSPAVRPVTRLNDGRAPRVVPRQLPAALPHFAGRQEERTALSGLLTEPSDATPAAAVVAISGTAGVGKTALAVHFAHDAAARFADGQLYVNMRGFDPSGTPVTPGEAISGFLDALDVQPAQMPAGLEARTALYRSLLAGRRMLIVIDNAQDAAHARPLLPGSPGCLVVVTSRSLLTGLAAVDGARLLTLDVLSVEEAGELLARKLGPGRVAADPEAASDLVVLCARLPLALAIAAAHAAVHPSFPLAALAAQLRDATARLDALNAGEETSDIRAVFSWSYRQLSPQAARMFRLLGLHPGPDTSAPAAASLAATPAAHAALDELVRAHLLTEHVPGRYAFHDLLRAYASEQAHAEDDEAGRQAAIGRVLDHYLHTAHTGALLLLPGREPLSLDPPSDGARPEALSDHAGALDWFTAEQAVLLSAVPYAVGTGFGHRAWQLTWTGETFFVGRGWWHEYAASQRIALAAAQRLGDPRALSSVYRGLGYACVHLGLYADAQEHYRLALHHSRDDPDGQVRAHQGIAWTYGQQHDYRSALTNSERALELSRNLGNRGAQARALNNAGWCHVELGDFARAIACCGAAYELQRELGDNHGQAGTLDTIGYAHHRLGQHAQAADCHQQAVTLLRGFGYTYELGIVLHRLGDARRAMGDTAGALDAWREAADLLDGLHHPDAGEVRAKLGELGAALGSPRN